MFGNTNSKLFDMSTRSMYIHPRLVFLRIGWHQRLVAAWIQVVTLQAVRRPPPLQLLCCHDQTVRLLPLSQVRVTCVINITSSGILSRCCIQGYPAQNKKVVCCMLNASLCADPRPSQGSRPSANSDFSRDVDGATGYTAAAAALSFGRSVGFCTLCRHIYSVALLHRKTRREREISK